MALDTVKVVDREILKFYDKSFDWVLTIGPRILLAGFLLVFGLWFIRKLRKKLSVKIGNKKVHSSLRPFIESLVYILLHIALFFIILQVLSIKLTVFAALIAAFGAAVGLALSGTLQNFASGIIILLLKPFKVGDNIIAQNMEGTVTSIQIFFTVINTFDNRTVIMPNSKLSNEVIINITKAGVRRMDVELKFKNEVNFQEVKEKLLKAFSDFKEVLKEPVPRIGVSAIEQDGYKVICNIWVKAHGFEDSRLMINEMILNTLKETVAAAKGGKQSDVQS